MQEVPNRIRYIVLAISVATVAYAQVPDSTVSHLGSVTGHVTCMDTRRPARFAEVLLVPKLHSEQSAADGNAPNAAKPAVQAQQTIVMADGRTTLDGSYTIRNIPPGDYFVVAKLAGYIAPALNADRMEDLNKILAGAPTVTVVSDRESIADLTLRRGATIAGTVRFDDGTPLVGGIVRAEPLSDTDDPPGIVTSATADDLGHFRVSGLPPGKYRVYTDIQIAGGMHIWNTGGPGSYVYSQGGKSSLAMHLFVYQPGTLRKSKAATLEIKGDEDVQGANLRVELSGLHSVMGRAAPRGSPCKFVLGFAIVFDDGDKSFYRAVDVEPDGNFQINFVPNGTYTLQVSTSCFRSPTIHAAGLEKEELINFKAAELPVVVMDRDVDAGEILLDELVVKP